MESKNIKTILLVGETGGGKSTLCNFLSDKKGMFEENASMMSGTKKS